MLFSRSYRKALSLLIFFLVLFVLMLVSCSSKKEMLYEIKPVLSPVIKKRTAVLPIFDNTDFSSRINALGLIYANDRIPYNGDISCLDSDTMKLLASYRYNKASYYLMMNDGSGNNSQKELEELLSIIEEQESALIAMGMTNPHEFANLGFALDRSNLSDSYTSPLSNAAVAILTHNLNRSNMFSLLERARIDDILREHQLMDSGFIEQTSARDVGTLIGAELLIMGNIKNFALERKHVEGHVPTGALLYLGIWALSGREPKAARDIIWHTDYLDVKNFRLKCSLDLRTVDAVTGEILSIFQGEADESVTTVYISDIGGGVEYSDDLAYKVLEKAVLKAAYTLIQETRLQPFRGRIANVSEIENIVYINAGRSQNIKPGDRFAIYSRDSLVEDPTTGVLLGFGADAGCIIEVFESYDHYSKAEIISDCKIERGDYAEYM